MRDLFSKNVPTKSNQSERCIAALRKPLDIVFHNSMSSGIFLILLTVAAMWLANGRYSEQYFHILHQHIVVAIGDNKIDMSLHHWINDALMVIFFFLVGAEIKKELIVGDLSSVKKALLPIIAALGGMIAPAIIFSLINMGADSFGGWGIPMATDIAFAVAVLLLLGERVPNGLMVILLALAIVDDLGAILVIALFYTEAPNFMMLMSAFACFGVLFFFNYSGIRASWAYFFVGVFMWLFMLFSGVHATIAGVLAAFSMPTKSIFSPEEFSAETRRLLQKFDESTEKDTHWLAQNELNELLQTLKHGIRKTQPPLSRMIHRLHIPVYFFVIPVFVLFNAGVKIEANVGLTDVFFTRPALGVFFGLVIGKFTGVFSSIYICVKKGWVQLPDGVNFHQIAGMSILAGIGFTMAIFVAELAYKTTPQYLTDAKMAILIGSTTAAVIGYIYLFALGNKK